MRTILTLSVLISSVITATGASAMPWSKVVQNETELCRVIEGEYIPYSVGRKNGQGQDVTLMFDSSAQRQLCSMVKEFPR